MSTFCRGAARFVLVSGPDWMSESRGGSKGDVFERAALWRNNVHRGETRSEASITHPLVVPRGGCSLARLQAVTRCS